MFIFDLCVRRGEKSQLAYLSSKAKSTTLSLRTKEDSQLIGRITLPQIQVFKGNPRHSKVFSASTQIFLFHVTGSCSFKIKLAGVKIFTFYRTLTLFMSVLDLILSFFFSFSGCRSLSHVCLFVTPWTVAYQAPLLMGFFKWEYCRKLSFPYPGDLPHQRIKPGVSYISCIAGGFFACWAIRESPICLYASIITLSWFLYLPLKCNKD